MRFDVFMAVEIHSVVFVWLMTLFLLVKGLPALKRNILPPYFTPTRLHGAITQKAFVLYT
jgi:hypothetical protein